MRPLLPIVTLLALAAGPARAATVRVSVDQGAESTRIVLIHSEPVPHTVESTRRKITILYAAPVEIEPAEMRVDGPLLERYTERAPGELVIETGPEYDRFESFELRNPYRLILDLQAKPSRRSRAERRRQAPSLPSTILVIDPGHGGVEEGAIGPGGSREKDVTLELARRLRQALQDPDSRISVVLTRDDDRAVGLDERTAVANHNRADLFLSLHLNASPRAGASGAETYYLSSSSTDDEARLLAAEENRGGKGDGLDLVLWELAQNHHLAASSVLAESVQSHMNQLTGTRNRGVRQAPFRVLMGAMMPAILVEVGFISNPEEEQRFKSPEYLNRVVDALVAAVREFLENNERFAGPQPSPQPDPGLE